MNRTDIASFFAAAFPNDVPAGLNVLIWTLPDKTSYWAKTAYQAAEIACKQGDAKADTYIGVGLASKTYGPKKRVINAQVAGLYGLWVDLDYADDVHSKKNLPSKDDALGFINELPKKPSMIVHSGHGYQCWWFFHEVWKFADDLQRDYASSLARGWIYKLRDLARSKGWDVDATIDLARVLRVPGTDNWKQTDDVRPVEIVASWPEVRYYPAEFNGGTPAQQMPLNGAKPIEGIAFTLNPQAEPPSSKWMALIDNDTRALKTWRRERADFGDQSPSAYDMSLATIAAFHGWADQEIVDLLIAFRRKHGEDLKLREDYYARTIERARRGTTTAREIDANQESDDVDPEVARGGLSVLFGIEIVKLTKFEGDPPSYMLQVARRGKTLDISLKDVDEIMSQRKFRKAVASAVDLIIPKVHDSVWEKRAQVLLDSLESVDLGPEARPASAAEQWINEYLASHRPSTDTDSAALSGRPFTKDGTVYVNLRQIAHWLKTAQGERVSNRELARMIKLAGWEQYSQFIPQQADGTAATTKSYWRRAAVVAESRT